MLKRRKTDVIKGNILIVEDDPLQVTLVRKSLNKISNFNIVKANTAEKGLTHCKEQCFDLIILDLDLPGINGIEFLSEIQSITPYVSIVIRSGEIIDTKTEIKLREMGIDDIIDKMKSLKLLQVMVERAFSRRLISYYDPMTNTLVKMCFNPSLGLELNKLNKNPSYEIAVVNIDYNDFKNINDTKGHDIGDQVLIKSTKIIKRSLRNTDLIFRMGGDEFNIIMPETSAKDATNIMKRICKKLRESKTIQKLIDKNLTISIGIAEGYPEDSTDSLFKRSDIAVFSSKKEREKGNDCIVVRDNKKGEYIKK